MPEPDGSGHGVGGLALVVYITNVLAEDLKLIDAWRVGEEEKEKEKKKKPAL